MVEELYSYFNAKSKMIKENIKKANNTCIETLIKFSPQFIDEIKQARSKQTLNSTNEESMRAVDINPKTNNTDFSNIVKNMENEVREKTQNNDIEGLKKFAMEQRILYIEMCLGNF